MKILTVIGARPQFIKAATVSRAITNHRNLHEVIVHTGQHFDSNMSDIFFEELSISKPDYNLRIGGGSHGAMTGRQIEAIEQVLLDEKPDWLLVYGDTNSTLAGALAAVKLHIPVAHVEAGLRSFNRRMPEEINRVLTDHSAQCLFAPTDIAVNNLHAEGINPENIHLTGDVMLDASLYYRNRSRQPAWFESLKIDVGKFVLATVHRAENTDDPTSLRAIFEGLASSTLPIILPLHPRTRARLSDYGIVPAAHVKITEPVGYLEMVWLEENCSMVCTDSGGVQKEAFFFNKPCITMRNETEWVELIDIGWNHLVGTDKTLISNGFSMAVTQTHPPQIYGNGNSAAAIVQILMSQS